MTQKVEQKEMSKEMLRKAVEQDLRAANALIMTILSEPPILDMVAEYFMKVHVESGPALDKIVEMRKQQENGGN